MTSLDQAEPHTYGGWRRPKGFGLGRLGPVGSGLLFGALSVAFLVLLATSQIIPAVLIAAAGFAAVGLVSIPDADGLTVGQRVAARVAHLYGTVTGRTAYRSGPLAHRVGTFRLPGLLAQSALAEHVDGQGRPFALLYVPRREHYSVVLAAEPEGAGLVDGAQVDQWVAHYGQWLGALGREPQLVAVSVTIETAPDSGSRLRREVDAAIDPGAPELARDVVSAVVEASPVGAATVRAFVALTFSSRVHKAAKARHIDEVAQDLGNRLPHIGNVLQATGAGAVRPVSAAALCEIVQTAYDPAAAQAFDAARPAGVEADWSNVGPTAAHAGWDAYRHDSGVSVTWEMVGAPRGAVTHDCLDALLRPHPKIARKRVTMLYRPISAVAAAKIVERDRDNATSRVRAARKPSARAEAEEEHAKQAAREEARGAGLLNLALLVTATVSDPEQLDAARLAIEQSATRLRLRPVHGSQDSAFAAALPLGIVLERHVRVPASLRGAL